MAGTLESTLANIPGLAGYLAQGQYNRQQETGDLTQMGTLLGLHKNIQAAQREQQFRAGLRPDMTQEELAAHAAQFAGPEKVMDVQQRSLDRKSAMESAAGTRDAVLAQAKATAEQTHELRMQGLKTSQERDAERARHNQVVEAIQGMGGKPPPGYRNTPTGQEPIPGGPADIKWQQQQAQDQQMLNSTISDLDRLAAEANRLKSHPGLEKATGVMAAVPLVGGTATIPGTDAANFKAGLETLKSQVGFGVLQNMRNNSKTGGALGQVSNIENKLLQANLATLETAQSSEEFKAALDRILQYTEAAKDRMRQAHATKHKEGSPAPAQPTPQAAPTPAGFQEGQTATNPQGVKIIYRNGQWRPQ